MSESSSPPPQPTAAVLVIGDEILSGRTKDANLPYIAEFLGRLGIALREGRVVADVEAEIVDALNALRARYSYVFTTGGIGPTHDDITADSVAAAFGVGISEHPDALAVMEKHYRTENRELNAARRRMARVPHGATLIDNPVSAAPGFQIENVFVLAGIPMVAQAMLEGVADRLTGGPRIETRNVIALLPEGAVAEALGDIQTRFPEIGIGSYPFLKGQTYGTNLVLRGTDIARLDAAAAAVAALVDSLGGTYRGDQD